MNLSTLQILTKSVESENENIWYMIYFVLFINDYMYNSFKSQQTMDRKPLPCTEKLNRKCIYTQHDVWSARWKFGYPTKCFNLCSWKKPFTLATLPGINYPNFWEILIYIVQRLINYSNTILVSSLFRNDRDN